MIRVCAPSRLHFGLFSLAAPDESSSPSPSRAFGGVGLMVETPALIVHVEQAPAWLAEGPMAVRALSVAQQAAAAMQFQGPLRVVVEHGIREHVGLGSGTQLALAVGRAVAHIAGRQGYSEVDLACLVGRGRRSAVGIHGFAQGGFLVEGGKRTQAAVSPLIARVPVPEDWRGVLLIPHGLEGHHGTREADVCRALDQSREASQTTDALCRMVLLGMLPALAERDVDAFGEALYDFNRQVGEMFRPWQGDRYAHPRTAEHLARKSTRLNSSHVSES